MKTRMKSSPCSALVWLRAHHIWSSVRCSETKMSHQRRLSSWKKQESQVSEPRLLSTPADTFLLNVCRHYSLSVWSGSYTSWLVFCDRPGKMAPSSDRSLSPGRTSGPASRQSWNTAEIQKGCVRDSCKKTGHNLKSERPSILHWASCLTQQHPSSWPLSHWHESLVTSVTDQGAQLVTDAAGGKPLLLQFLFSLNFSK